MPVQDKKDKQINKTIESNQLLLFFIFNVLISRFKIVNFILKIDYIIIFGNSTI